MSSVEIYELRLKDHGGEAVANTVASYARGPGLYTNSQLLLYLVSLLFYFVHGQRML